MNIEAINVIKTAAALIALWLLWYYCFRPLIIESYRQQLFKIRDRLFDYAADGNLSFNSDAYARLRLLTNSMIRFGHQVTFSRALFTAASVVVRPDPMASRGLEYILEPISSLPESQKSYLLKLHAEILVETLWYMVLRCPPLFLTLILFFLYGRLRGRIRQFSEAVPIFGFRVPGVVLMEAQAVESNKFAMAA